MPTPSNVAYRSMCAYFWNTNPLTTLEAAYIQLKNDIISLGAVEENIEIRALIEKWLTTLDSFLSHWHIGIVHVMHTQSALLTH